MFGGTGTTCFTANKIDRKGIMYDTNPDNIKLALEGYKLYNDAIANLNITHNPSKSKKAA